MALLAFHVQADYEEAIRLRDVCKDLEKQLNKATYGTAQWNTLSRQLADNKTLLYNLCSAAAQAGNYMQTLFKKKDNELVKQIQEAAEALAQERKELGLLRKESAQYEAQMQSSKRGSVEYNRAKKNRNRTEAKITFHEQESDDLIVKMSRLQSERMVNVQESGLVKYANEVQQVSKDAFGAMSGYLAEATQEGSKVVSIIEQIASTAAGVSIGNLMSGGLMTGFHALQGMAEKAVQIRSQMQDIESNMTIFLKSRDAAAAFTQDLSKAAYYNMNEFSQLVSASKQLLAYGNKVENIIPTIQKLSEIQVGTGGNLAQIVDMYNRAKSTGYVDSRTQMSWASQGIVLADELKKLGETATGKVTFDQLNKVIDSMTGQGGMFHGVQAEMMTNISAEEGQMDDQLHTMYDEMGKYFEDMKISSYRLRGAMAENWRDIADAIGMGVVALGSYRAALVSCKVVHEMFAGGEMTNALNEWANKLNEMAQSINETSEAAWSDFDKLTNNIGAPNLDPNELKAIAQAEDDLAEKRKVAKDCLRDYKNAEKEWLDEGTSKYDAYLDAKKKLEDANEEVEKSEKVLENLKEAGTQRVTEAVNGETVAEDLNTASKKANAAASKSGVASSAASAAATGVDTTATNTNTTSTGANAAAQAAQAGATNASAGAMNADAVATAKNTIATGANTVATGGAAVTHNVLTVAVHNAAKSFLTLSAAVLTCPYTWIALAVAGLGVALYKYLTAASETEKAEEALKNMREANNEAMQKELSLVEQLAKASDAETASTWQRAKALQELNTQYNDLASQGKMPQFTYREAWDEEKTEDGEKKTVHHEAGLYNKSGQSISEYLETAKPEEIQKDLQEAIKKRETDNALDAAAIAQRYAGGMGADTKVRNAAGTARSESVAEIRNQFKEFLSKSIVDEDVAAETFDEYKDNVDQMVLQMAKWFQDNTTAIRLAREEEERKLRNNMNYKEKQEYYTEKNKQDEKNYQYSEAVLKAAEQGKFNQAVANHFNVGGTETLSRGRAEEIRNAAYDAAMEAEKRMKLEKSRGNDKAAQDAAVDYQRAAAEYGKFDAIYRYLTTTNTAVDKEVTVDMKDVATAENDKGELVNGLLGQAKDMFTGFLAGFVQKQKEVAAQSANQAKLDPKELMSILDHQQKAKSDYKNAREAIIQIKDGRTNFKNMPELSKFINGIETIVKGTDLKVGEALNKINADYDTANKEEKAVMEGWLQEILRILGVEQSNAQSTYQQDGGHDLNDTEWLARVEQRKANDKKLDQEIVNATNKRYELEQMLMVEGEAKLHQQRAIEHRKTLEQLDKQHKDQIEAAEQQAKNTWLKDNPQRTAAEFEQGKDGILAQSQVYKDLVDLADEFYRTQVKIANLKYEGVNDLLDKYATIFDKETKRVDSSMADYARMIERFNILSSKSQYEGTMSQEENDRLNVLKAKDEESMQYANKPNLTEDEELELVTLEQKYNNTGLSDREKQELEQLQRELNEMPTAVIGSMYEKYYDTATKTQKAIDECKNHQQSLDMIKARFEEILKSGDMTDEMRKHWEDALSKVNLALKGTEGQLESLNIKAGSSILDYLEKYGTTEQKIEAITKKAQAQIDATTDLWEKKALEQKRNADITAVLTNGANNKNENYLRRRDNIEQARQLRAQQHEESITDLKGRYDKATTKEDKQRYANLITQEERQAKLDDNEFLTQGLNLSLEEMKEDPQYFMAMTDAANATTEGLKRTKEMLEQLLLMGKDLDPKDYEALTNALNKVGDEYAGRNPFRGWLEASKEGVNATKELEKAQKEQAVEQEKYDLLGAYKAPKPELERKEGESDEEFKKRQEEADKQWEENRNKSINEYVSRRDSAETAHDAAWTEMQIAGNVYDEVMADPTATAEQQAEAEQRLAEAKQQELDTSIALQQTESDLTVAREGKGTTQAYVQQETNLTNAKKKTAKAEADKLKADQKGAKATQKLGSDLNKLGGGISAVGDSIAKADAKTAEFIKGTGAFVQSIGSGITQIGKVATAEVKGMEAACAWLMIVAAAIQATMWILDVIGVFDQDTTYQDAKEEYDELIKVWDTLIARKKEYLNESWGQEALNVGKEIESLQKDQQEAARKLALKYWESGADASAHSYGYRQNRDLHQFFGEWSAAAGVTIRTIEDLASLSGEQLKKVQEANAFAWTQIDTEARDALEDIIKAEDALKDSTDELKEHLLGISFDSMRDDFVSNLMDMQYTVGDATANINKMMMQALLNNVVGVKMKKKLEDFYNMFYDEMKVNGGTMLTEAQVKNLQKQYAQLNAEAIEQRDMIAKITGYEDTASGGSNGGTGGIAANVTQDSIDEMTGRLTSVQMIAQGIAMTQDLVGQSVISLTQSMLEQLRQNDILAENRFAGIAEQIAETYLEIQAIHEDTTAMRGAVNRMAGLMADWDNNIKTL